MSLTAAEITRFRRKIDDTGTPPAYTDDEIQDLVDEAGGSFYGGVLLAIEELLMGTAKLTDYTQNQSQEKRSGVFDRLYKMRALYQGKLVEGRQQVRMVGVRQVPPRYKETPDGGCEEWET